MAAGYGIEIHEPVGTVPPAEAFPGPVSRALVHGELALQATPATAHAFRLAADWDAGGARFLLGGRYERVSAGEPEPAVGLAGLLLGSRDRWEVLLGVVPES